MAASPCIAMHCCQDEGLHQYFLGVGHLADPKQKEPERSRNFLTNDGDYIWGILPMLPQV